MAISSVMATGVDDNTEQSATCNVVKQLQRLGDPATAIMTLLAANYRKEVYLTSKFWFSFDKHAIKMQLNIGLL